MIIYNNNKKKLLVNLFCAYLYYTLHSAHNVYIIGAKLYHIIYAHTHIYVPLVQRYCRFNTELFFLYNVCMEYSSYVYAAMFAITMLLVLS